MESNTLRDDCSLWGPPTSGGVVHSTPKYLDERFGVEVEAEGLVSTEWERMRIGVEFNEPALAATRPLWIAKSDGSLRHNGVEFVTAPIPWESVNKAVHVLWEAFDLGLVRTSIRAGIHVHYNVAHMSPLRYMKLLQTYALAEPLLFQMVGLEREQNIYCVPWYMGDGEQDLMGDVLAYMSNGDPVQAYAAVMQSCKYSALFCGPLTSLGTVEYRMAPTFTRREDMLAWLRVVRLVGQHVADPRDPSAWATLFGLLSEAWGRQLDVGAYRAILDDYDVVSRAVQLQPCTYKAESWGQPASMAFGESKWAVHQPPLGRHEVFGGRDQTAITLDELVSSDDEEEE